jgi:hypothetical protein
MFYGCIKVQHKSIKKLKLGIKFKGAKKSSVLWSGAPDCPMCHLEMAMVPETRNLVGFYPIRVRVWINFHTHGFVNGHKCISDGFMGTGLFL